MIRSQDKIFTAFNGTDEFVTINSILPTIQSDNNGTIGGWFFKEANSNETLWSINLNLTNFILLRFIGGGFLEYFARRSGQTRNRKTTTNSFANDTFHYVELSQNGTDITLKVNNIVQTFSSDTGNSKGAWITQFVPTSFHLGNTPITGGNKFNGNEDEIFYSSSVISAPESTAIFNADRRPFDYSQITGIVSHYGMNTLNPVDTISGFDGVSNLMDSSNIISGNGDVVGNQGLIIKSQGADITDNQGLKLSIT